jgi:hypothetical protein
MKFTGRDRRGFALFVAIALIGIITITMAVLAGEFHAQAVRTQNANDDAQLRQLLLSGAEFARQRVVAGAPAAVLTGAIALPDSPMMQAATLELSVQDDADPQERIIEIRAATRRRHAAQRVHFSRRNDMWVLASADLIE